MTDDEVIDLFVWLFRGRGDCYGSAKGFCVHKPLTRATFEAHLRSTDPEDHIGVYCMVGEQCSWGCIDIDGKDFPDVTGYAETLWDWDRMWTLALNLRSVLSIKGIFAHIEQSKNGYHLWVFPNKPLASAAHMRRALMAACTAIGYSPKEVNPKAEGPRPGTKGLGNFVRLPYGGALSEPRTDRIMLHDDGSTWPLKDWLDWMARGGAHTDIQRLEAVAALWTPPPVAHHEVDFEHGLDDEQLQKVLHLLDGKSYTIWKDGPLPGSDRSNTLARLAYQCAERGITATQAFAVVKSADERWGKFKDRADGLEQLARFIDKAYS